MTVSDHRELVGALLAVEGVADAAVEPDPDGAGPGTLRLQLAPGADEVAVAGAVNRLLRARFGLAVDADRVRVLEESVPAPEAPEAPEAPAPPVESASAPADDAPPLPAVRVTRPGRVVIERVQMLSVGLGVVATVSLSLDGSIHVGESDGAATPTSVHRTVADATLRAVERFVGGRVRFEVEHVELTSSGEDRTALVVVTMLTDRGSERLSGASVVREDVRQAVIRATLAAINRRLEVLLGR
ncbi:MAG TPA: hypothetical protein VF314_12955 [Actinomycetes bacterium]